MAVSYAKKLLMLYAELDLTNRRNERADVAVFDATIVESTALPAAGTVYNTPPVVPGFALPSILYVVAIIVSCIYIVKNV
jgi:hypothetical protein